MAEESAGCRKAWSAIRAANDRLEEKRDRKAGEELLRLLPTKKKILPTDCTTHSETVDALDRDHRFRQQMLAEGADLAYQLYFRMINASDGAFAEDLDIDLGKSIQRYPQKFLRYLRAEHGDGFCPSGMLGNLGEADLESKVIQAELKKRQTALEKVTDRSLEKIKATCLKTLKTVQSSR